MATPELFRTPEGILTAKEPWAVAKGVEPVSERWLNEIRAPHKEEREKREVQEYIRQVRELSEENERREAEIAAVREHARLIAEYTLHLQQQAQEREKEQAKAKSAAAELEHKFRALAEEWYLGTMFRSSYLDKILHPAYQKILTLGQAVVPFILRELKDMPSDWFWALRTLTDADPTTPEQAGDMGVMAEAWLAWGRERGLIE